MRKSSSPTPATLPPSIARTWSGAWHAVVDATRGTRRDYSTGPVGRAIFVLAVPMVLEMVMESLFAVADVFWVGHLGATPLRPSVSRRH